MRSYLEEEQEEKEEEQEEKEEGEVLNMYLYWANDTD
jgi:hypothetical protein